MTASLSPLVLRYGRDEPLPEQRLLRAGPLSLVYEHGDLRYIRLGEREIIRRIYVAVRDHNWATVPATLHNVEISADADSFEIRYDASHQAGPIEFAWHATISGAADGTIRFTMDGAARTTFLRNRIGFCVLHPAACAGAACVVEHSDGTYEAGEFPEQIAPHQPFIGIRAIWHEVAPGVNAAVRFDGDVFEMEDQRNWIDASFKTYGTPLSLPFPVEIAAGTELRQAVTLMLDGDPAPYVAAEDQREVVIALTDAPAAASACLPGIGLSVASHGQPLTERQVARLRVLRLAHLRVDLALSDPRYGAVFGRASRQAAALGAPLEIALVLSAAADDELRALRALLDELRPTVARWLIFHAAEQVTGVRWIDLARARLASYAPGAPIGAGTNAYFTQLNRQRPPLHALDLVSYSLNPQVHAFDNASLVETLAAQAMTVRSARQFCADRPIMVSPVTLRPRFNPDATGPAPALLPGELPPEVDERQMALFGAAWTLGSLKYLAESGVASLTYYETTGWRGVLETETGSGLPQRFPSLPDSVFPLYHVLADIGELAGALVLLLRSSAPLLVDGLALRYDERTRLLLANMSPVAQFVRLTGLAPEIEVCTLDETNAETAMRAPERFRAQPGIQRQTDGGALRLTLHPYAVIRIDSR